MRRLILVLAMALLPSCSKQNDGVKTLHYESNDGVTVDLSIEGENNIIMDVDSKIHVEQYSLTPTVFDDFDQPMM